MGELKKPGMENKKKLNDLTSADMATIILCM